jgi:uncharacterized protein YggU (UPF0235/DUF167 family)
VKLRVRVTPRASKARFVVEGDGTLRAWVPAPAEGGRANEALRELLAGALHVRRQDVVIVAGARSREKTIEIPDAAARALAG